MRLHYFFIICFGTTYYYILLQCSLSQNAKLSINLRIFYIFSIYTLYSNSNAVLLIVFYIHSISSMYLYAEETDISIFWTASVP